jgi:hypothetical protein
MSVSWTKSESKLAFHLYCQIPFGKVHRGNPDIIRLASLIGRSPSSVAMKMLNFASLDPAITGTGRRGLSAASRQDREIWDEFHADWEGLALECQALREEYGDIDTTDLTTDYDLPESFIGESKPTVIQQRIKQSFFRRIVLSSYRGRCCMSGLSEPSLLIASHIIPWSKDRENRLNPSNGLCLSALHDKAFDQGFLSLSDDFRIIVSAALYRRSDEFINRVLIPLDGKRIELPERFIPDIRFITKHRNDVFLGSGS